MFPDDRPTPVARDGQIGVDLEWFVAGLSGDAGDPIVLPKQAGDFGVHLEAEARVALGLVRHEVQEIPLRHEHDVLAGRWQAAEIDEIERLAIESDSQLLHGLVWDFAQELIEQSELVHHLGGRRMDRIATKVAQKVTVLLHEEGLHARSREQEGEHHAGRSAAGYQAPGLPNLHGQITVPLWCWRGAPR